MFGLYRTVLAVFVVLNHLVDINLGHYAVIGFFVLSGYLMTLVTTVSYGHTWLGFRSFAENRALRLYPVYWGALALSGVCIFIIGEDTTTAYRSYISFPRDLSLWLQNISLVYLNFEPSKISPRLSPATWALTVELFYYLVIGLGLSKTKKRSSLWLLISLAFLFSTYVFDLSGALRYGSIASGSLPFALGACIYHFGLGDKFQRVASRLAEATGANASTLTGMLTVGGIIVFCGNSLFAHWASAPRLQSLCFLINFVICSVMVCLLAKMKSLRFKKWDSLIGQYSYPIYLIHWQTGLIASMLVFGTPVRGWNEQGVISLLASIPILIIISWMLIRFVDHPVNRIRDHIRSGATSKLKRTGDS